MRQGSNGLRLFAALLLPALVVGCSGGGGSSSWPLPRTSPIGTQSTPSRPLLPTNLPRGWVVANRRLERKPAFRSAAQTLYLAEGSTPSKGRALLVGHVSADGGGYAPTTCEPPALGYDQLPSEIVRWGRGLALTRVDGPANEASSVAYVFGRDVTDDQLRQAAASLRWASSESGVPHVDVPKGFALRATSPLAAHVSGTAPAWVRLNGPGGRWITISQQEGNAAVLTVEMFWSATTGHQRCLGASGWLVQKAALVSPTFVRMTGTDDPQTRRAMRAVSDGLKAVSPQRFCAKRPPYDVAELICDS